MLKVRRIVLLCLLMAVLLVIACEPGRGHWSPANKANFWAGLWHGSLLPYSLVSSLFHWHWSIYEPFNVGFGYAAGFCIGAAAFLVTGFSALDLLAAPLWWLLMAALHAVLSIPRVFMRVFGRSDDTPPAERPTGYKWGYFFAATNCALGVAAAGASVLLTVTAPGLVTEQVVRHLAYAVVLAPIALVLLAMSACAFVRRGPFCYWVVALGLLFALGWSAVNAFWGVFRGAWLANLMAALLQVAWLAYFGNRRHRFGFLREGTAAAPVSPPAEPGQLP